ncbi:MAG: hypothetical protein HY075_04765 [Deltaproteobacteria bacterium]|nr:hypothetical protein [Deltaproteobacteria bacterium]
MKKLWAQPRFRFWLLGLATQLPIFLFPVSTTEARFIGFFDLVSVAAYLYLDFTLTGLELKWLAAATAAFAAQFVAFHAALFSLAPSWAERRPAPDHANGAFVYVLFLLAAVAFRLLARGLRKLAPRLPQLSPSPRATLALRLAGLVLFVALAHVSARFIMNGLNDYLES